MEARLGGQDGVFLTSDALTNMLIAHETELSDLKASLADVEFRASNAEFVAAQIKSENSPGRMWVMYGLPTGLAAIVVGVIAGFYIGMK